MPKHERSDDAHTSIYKCACENTGIFADIASDEVYCVIHSFGQRYQYINYTCACGKPATDTNDNDVFCKFCAHGKKPAPKPIHIVCSCGNRATYWDKLNNWFYCGKHKTSKSHHLEETKCSIIECNEIAITSYIGYMDLCAKHGRCVHEQREVGWTPICADEGCYEAVCYQNGKLAQYCSSHEANLGKSQYIKHKWDDPLENYPLIECLEDRLTCADYAKYVPEFACHAQITEIITNIASYDGWLINTKLQIVNTKNNTVVELYGNSVDKKNPDVTYVQIPTYGCRTMHHMRRQCKSFADKIRREYK